MYYYNSSLPGAPQLTNTWGDFNKIINFICDGWMTFNVIRIEPHSDKLVKIFFTPGTVVSKEIIGSVIEIRNSTNYSRKFMIDNIDITGGFVYGYNSTFKFVDGIIETTPSSAYIVPAGFSRKFGGITENRTVVKFKDGIEFRIDDRNYTKLLTPVVTEGPSWLKAARLCMSANFDTIDSSSARVNPYDPLHPTENFMPDGDYIGRAIMPYNAITTYPSAVPMTSAIISFIGLPKWRIWASDNFIIIQILENSSTRCFNYHFGSFNRSNKTKVNGIYLTRCLVSTYNTTNSYILDNNSGGTKSIAYISTSNPSGLNYIYDNKLDKSALYTFVGSLSIGGKMPSGSSVDNNGKIPLLDGDGNNVIVSDYCITESNNFNLHGTMYDIKFIHSKILVNEQIFTEIDGLYYQGIMCEISSTYTGSAFIRIDRP